MKSLCLSELSMLREELMCSLDRILECGFIGDEMCIRADFQKTRYRRLVRLYRKIDEIIIDTLDEMYDETE